jgi:hypothetical protein
MNALLNNPPRDAVLTAFESVLPITRVHISDNYSKRAVLFVNEREESLCFALDIEATDRVRAHFGDKIVEARACEIV